MNTSLLPIGTKVHHSGHGDGVIVKYNGKPKNAYIESMLDKAQPELKAAVDAGLGLAIISSFYSGDRFPYVVQFKPTASFPDGYKDVYDVDGVVMKVMK